MFSSFLHFYPLYFHFQNNEFCMSKLLKTYPLKIKTTKLSSQEAHQLHKLIDENLPLSGISMRMNRFESVIIDEIVILMRRGMLITKTHLKHLVGASDDLFKHIKSTVTDDDLINLDDIDRIRVKFSNNILITGNMLTLVLNYLRVRQFLDSINLAYFDIDENRLVNGHVLLGSNAIETNASNSEQVDEKEKSTEVGPSSSRDVLKYSYENSKQMESSKSKESVSHWQLENNDMQVDDEWMNQVDESVTFKPLQLSQKPNQTNDIKQFEAKSPVKMPTAQTKASGVAGKKRAAPKPTLKIEYFSDSDSDGKDDNHNSDKQPQQTKRTLPQWMTTKKPTGSNVNSNTNQSSAVRKKSFF